MNPPNEFDAQPGGTSSGIDADRSGAPTLVSVIGSDILVTGNIEAEVDLHIEGRVVGDVRCATLILGAQSSVVGRIFATRVRVSGSVEGAIDTTDLAIEAAARVKGDISYSRLRVANGGTIEGTMKHVAEGAENASNGGKLKLVEAGKGKGQDVE